MSTGEIFISNNSPQNLTLNHQTSQSNQLNQSLSDRRLNESKSTNDLNDNLKNHDQNQDKDTLKSKIVIKQNTQIVNTIEKYQQYFYLFDSQTRNSIPIFILENIMEELLELPRVVINDNRMLRLSDILKNCNYDNQNDDDDNITDYRQKLFNWIYHYISQNSSMMHHLVSNPH